MGIISNNSCRAEKLLGDGPEKLWEASQNQHQEKSQMTSKDIPRESSENIPTETRVKIPGDTVEECSWKFLNLFWRNYWSNFERNSEKKFCRVTLERIVESFQEKSGEELWKKTHDNILEVFWEKLLWRCQDKSWKKIHGNVFGKNAERTIGKIPHGILRKNTENPENSTAENKLDNWHLQLLGIVQPNLTKQITDIL